MIFIVDYARTIHGMLHFSLGRMTASYNCHPLLRLLLVTLSLP